MATVTKGYTFGSTETVTNTKLHTLADSATVTGIVNADVSAGAAIDSSKVDMTSAGFLTTGTPTPTCTGDWTFTGDVITDDFIASLASIGTLNASAMISANATMTNATMTALSSIDVTTSGLIASLVSIADLNASYAMIASLATLPNLDVVNVNGSAYTVGELSSIKDYGSSTSSSTAKTNSDLKICYGYTGTIGTGNTVVITNLPFTSSTSYTVIPQCITDDASLTKSALNVERNSGAQFTIYQDLGETVALNWMAIGT